MDLLYAFQEAIKDEIRQENPNLENFVESINDAIEKIHLSYAPEGLSKKSNALDYRNIYLRCAYVYLYATSHSHMVSDAFRNLFDERPRFLADVIRKAISEHGELRYCSIGGGPGSDIVGTLLFLKESRLLGNDCVKVHLIDGYYEWAQTFLNIRDNFDRRELFPPNSIKVTFQDLLSSISPITKKAIQQANLITIVKFVSAIIADLEKAGELLRNIFNMITIGTVVLLIDNAGGQPFDFTLKTAEMNGMRTVVKPMKHVLYKVDLQQEPFIHQRLFKKPPQNQGKVSIAFMEKVRNMSERGQKRHRSFSCERSEFSTAQSPLLIQYGDSRKEYMPYATPSKEHRIVEGRDENGSIFFTATPVRSHSSSSPLSSSNASSVALPNERRFHRARRHLPPREKSQFRNHLNQEIPLINLEEEERPSLLDQDRKWLHLDQNESIASSSSSSFSSLNFEQRNKRFKGRRQEERPDLRSMEGSVQIPIPSSSILPNPEVFNFTSFVNEPPNFNFGPNQNDFMFRANSVKNYYAGPYSSDYYNHHYGYNNTFF